MTTAFAPDSAFDELDQEQRLTRAKQRARTRPGFAAWITPTGGFPCRHEITGETLEDALAAALDLGNALHAGGFSFSVRGVV